MSLQPRIMSADWLKSDEMRWLTVMARLAPGGSPRRAATALEALRRRLQPKTALDVHLALEPGARGITQGRDLVEGLVFALMALVAVVLLIACCNLANLLLGRGATRTHEIGVRLALGAGRGRVVRQLLTESLALSIIGGVAAYALAAWAWQFLIASVDMQRYLSQWDWHAPLFTAAATVLAACLFSLAPALVTTKVDLLTALQSGRRSYSAGHRSQRLGRTLVAAQVSVSLLLLYGAALLGRSFWNLQHRDLGFRPQGLLMAKLDVELDFSNTARDAAIGRPLLDRLNNLPGVVSAAIASAGPFGNSSYTSALSAPGHPSEENSHHVAFVSPRYFETMGIRIVAGRGIEETDHATAPKVAVISQSVARRLFGDANPVGRLVSETPNYDDREALRIVGVANDACFTSARDGAPLVFYIPLAQEMEPVTSVMVRTAAEPRSMIAAVRSALRETAPDRRIEAIEPAQEAVGSTVSSDFLLTTFTGGFSLLALALTSLGVYSVVAYAMSGRKREIGIRLALGATRTDVTRMVAREFAVLVGGSAVVGAAAALAMARLARGSLFGVAPNDYLSLGAAVLVLTAVAALAVGIPARRASRLDPMDALRQE
jgi:predicted permease